MKKIMLAVVMLVGLVVPMHAAQGAQNYNSGNLLLGVGLGASIYGGTRFVAHPSVELLVGTKDSWAFGITVSSSLNFGSYFSASLAPMFTAHYTILPRWDMYMSLGVGLLLHPSTPISGGYSMHVGYGVGFNVILTPAWFWFVGVEGHGAHHFVSTGVKVRFGDASKIGK